MIVLSFEIQRNFFAYFFLIEESNSAENDFDAEGDDDQAEFHAESELVTHPAVQSRWPTRVRYY